MQIKICLQIVSEKYLNFTLLRTRDESLEPAFVKNHKLKQEIQ